jgi:hypothetical protein
MSAKGFNLPFAPVATMVSSGPETDDCFLDGFGK